MGWEMIGIRVGGNKQQNEIFDCEAKLSSWIFNERSLSKLK